MPVMSFDEQYKELRRRVEIVSKSAPVQQQYLDSERVSLGGVYAELEDALYSFSPWLKDEKYLNDTGILAVQAVLTMFKSVADRLDWYAVSLNDALWEPVRQCAHCAVETLDEQHRLLNPRV